MLVMAAGCCWDLVVICCFFQRLNIGNVHLNGVLTRPFAVVLFMCHAVAPRYGASISACEKASRWSSASLLLGQMPGGQAARWLWILLQASVRVISDVALFGCFPWFCYVFLGILRCSEIF